MRRGRVCHPISPLEATLASGLLLSLDTPGTRQPQGLCACCSLCPECSSWSANRRAARSLRSSRPQLQCHLPREATPDLCPSLRRKCPPHPHPLQCVFLLLLFSFLSFSFIIYFIDFLQRGRQRDRELETSMRENHPSAASCTPPTGDVPTTKVHALDRN
uniref:Uncharacterized protein n=1 Tax=Pipistrellus kuhlii TaxID=59472 RepID=A0A7J7Y9A1_PIPKU|nr:hypothetical protein mPipKuh1_010355 [Pipistrellus kuhlii]